MCKSVQEALDKLYKIFDSLTEVVLVTLVCIKTKRRIQK